MSVCEVIWGDQGEGQCRYQCNSNAAAKRGPPIPPVLINVPAPQLLLRRAGPACLRWPRVRGPPTVPLSCPILSYAISYLAPVSTQPPTSCCSAASGRPASGGRCRGPPTVSLNHHILSYAISYLAPFPHNRPPAVAALRRVSLPQVAGGAVAVHVGADRKRAAVLGLGVAFGFFGGGGGGRLAV